MMRSEARSGWMATLIGKPIAGYLGGRDNSLNLVRILAASAVLISHSFVMASGNEMTEPLRASTGISLGRYSVAVFFGISGLLIARSFDRRRSVWHFIAARFFRLWPGLAVALSLIAFVLGPLLTTLPLAQYFGSREVWAFVPRNLTLFLLSEPLPGLFDHTPLPKATNGSLWSLFYEVACYGGVAVVGYLGWLRRKTGFALFFVAVVLAHGWSIFAAPTHGLAYRLDLMGFVGFPFALGMAAYVWRDQLPLGPALFAVLWALATALAATPYFGSAIMVAVVYSALWFGFCVKGPFLLYNRVGDFSYGTYIFAFPAQQTLMDLYPEMSAGTNIALALPITLVLAYASWHLIEKPMLALVAPAGDWLNRILSRSPAA